MRIGIDLDDVLAATVPALIDYHNRTFGTAYVLDDFFSYEWWKVWGGTREQSIQKAFTFFTSAEGLKIPPIPLALDRVSHLAKDHELLIITSRQQELTDITHKWIATHFPHIFQEIIITNHAQWSFGGTSRTKCEVCIEKKCTVLIEDNLEYANECAEYDIQVFLLDYPWNKGKTHSKVKRVNSWSNIRF